MTDATHAQEPHGHGHDDDHDEGVPHFSLRDYTIGFIASLVLTAVPFSLVLGDVLDSARATAIVLLAFAAVQIVVHMVFFLHMNTRSEGGWNVLALVFTLVLVVITLGGSLWIMHHLNVNMMPGHATHAWQQAREDGTHAGHDAPPDTAPRDIGEGGQDGGATRDARPADDDRTMHEGHGDAPEPEPGADATALP